VRDGDALGEQINIFDVKDSLDLRRSICPSHMCAAREDQHGQVEGNSDAFREQIKSLLRYVRVFNRVSSQLSRHVVRGKIAPGRVKGMAMRRGVDIWSWDWSGFLVKYSSLIGNVRKCVVALH
jgi:hypothetical protein